METTAAEPKTDQHKHQAGVSLASGRRKSSFDQRKKARSTKKFQRLLEYVRENIIGNDVLFEGPFGPRPVTVCDFDSAGRPLQFIEDFLRCHVFPVYGHAQTTTSISSIQTAAFLDSARDTVKGYFNCTDDDRVYFVGGGAYGAVQKLTRILGLSSKAGKSDNTVVFLGPYEDYRHVAPWREVGVKVERVIQNEAGHLDMGHLVELLKAYKKKKFKMVASFAAASHVTGIASDVVRISQTLHDYGALSFWDFTTAAPNQRFDMNSSDADGYLDAVFCSPDILLGGGTGCAGLMIVKRKLLTSSKDSSLYPKSGQPDTEEERVASNMTEAIRTGLVFQLTKAIGTEMIEAKNAEICRRAFGMWNNNPYLIQLGPKSEKKIPIFSFLVLHPETKTFLHHNFVAMLLNDLYGIQAQGGSGNSGPYMEELLEIDEDLHKILNVDLSQERNQDSGKSFESMKILKTGCTSVYISYVLSNHAVGFVLEAVNQVAKHGWKLLPLYECNAKLGVWKHRHYQYAMDSLKNIQYKMGGMKFTNSTISQYFRAGKETLREILTHAEGIFEEAYLICKNSDAEDDPKINLEEKHSDLVWFLQPSEALRMLKSKTNRQPIKLEELVDMVFFPRTFASDENENALRSSFATSPGNDSGHADTDSGTSSDELTDEENEEDEAPDPNYKPLMSRFLENRSKNHSQSDDFVQTDEITPTDSNQEIKTVKPKRQVTAPKNYKKHVERMLSFGYLTRYKVRKDYNSSPDVINNFTKLPPINKQEKSADIPKS